MPVVLLTSHIVSTYQVPTGCRKADLFDEHTKGLVLEVRATGGSTYYLRYRDRRQKIRLFKLADSRDVSLTQARKLAENARTRIAMGEDPAGDKKILKSVPSFSSFISEQYLPFVKTYKRSWQTDESLLRNHLIPRFGKKYMDEITRDDILRMMSSRIAEGAKPGTANRLLIMMRYIFNLALRWEVSNVKSNPTKGVHLLEENNKKERYLSNEEAQRLYQSVCSSENTMLKYIVPMLILTGARKREVLDAKWSDLDLINRRWRIATTKAGKARHIPLSDGAMQILMEVPRDENCQWVFANPDTKKPYVSIFCAWNSARKHAGLQDVRMHDLRHSFASMLVNSGRTLYEVQHLLGHTQVKTTQRYSHLSQETLLSASNAASHQLSAVFKIQQQNNILQIAA